MLGSRFLSHTTRCWRWFYGVSTRLTIKLYRESIDYKASMITDEEPPAGGCFPSRLSVSFTHYTFLQVLSPRYFCAVGHRAVVDRHYIVQNPFSQDCRRVRCAPSLYRVLLMRQWQLPNLLHCTAGSSRSFTAIRNDAGLCCGSRLREGRSVCLCWAHS